MMEQRNLFERIPQLQLFCKKCKTMVDEVSDLYTKDDILYNRIYKYQVYCYGCVKRLALEKDE